MTPRSDPAAAYLGRLGLPGDLPPTLGTLAEVHRRHLDAVPYESLLTGVDDAELRALHADQWSKHEAWVSGGLPESAHGR